MLFSNNGTPQILPRGNQSPELRQATEEAIRPLLARSPPAQPLQELLDPRITSQTFQGPHVNENEAQNISSQPGNSHTQRNDVSSNQKRDKGKRKATEINFDVVSVDPPRNKRVRFQEPTSGRSHAQNSQTGDSSASSALSTIIVRTDPVRSPPEAGPSNWWHQDPGQLAVSADSHGGQQGLELQPQYDEQSHAGPSERYHYPAPPSAQTGLDENEDDSEAQDLDADIPETSYAFHDDDDDPWMGFAF
ncbi:hypothetical protein F4777DRAFT_583163 [Nemania sp. FL0916]|nr:hypothetical protein F4777DRAFT_583163 [Nemania sp. FL0916]